MASGKIEGCDDGIFVYCGSISASGFHGAIVLRTGDVAGEDVVGFPSAGRSSPGSPRGHGITWLTVYADGQSAAAAAPLDAA